METLGTRLKSAREAKGLSIPELAKITRIKIQQIDGLEHDNFSTIPAPTYGKGFVKLICQVLEVDAAELVAQYQAQLDAQPLAPKAREAPRKVTANKTRGRPEKPQVSPLPSDADVSGFSTPAFQESAPPEATASRPRGPAPRLPSLPVSREVLLRRWPLLTAAALLLIGMLLLPWACRRGRQPDPLQTFDFKSTEIPLLAVPDTPLFALPESPP